MMEMWIALPSVRRYAYQDDAGDGLRLAFNNWRSLGMDKHPAGSTPSTMAPKKIYVTLIGSAPMASLDALMLTLERFKGILTSDSARSRFETTIRSIQPSLAAVHAFIDAVYAQKDPTLSVTMSGRTLIVEINQTKDEFLDCIHDYDVEEILSHITAVGSMPAKKSAAQKTRDYTAFGVKYDKGKFVKSGF